jgi:hypothetical protein
MFVGHHNFYQAIYSLSYIITIAIIIDYVCWQPDHNINQQLGFRCFEHTKSSSCFKATQKKCFSFISYLFSSNDLEFWRQRDPKVLSLNKHQSHVVYHNMLGIQYTLIKRVHIIVTSS